MDLNHRPSAYETPALTPELRWLETLELYQIFLFKMYNARMTDNIKLRKLWQQDQESRKQVRDNLKDTDHAQL